MVKPFGGTEKLAWLLWSPFGESEIAAEEDDEAQQYDIEDEKPSS